jgi:hypothetical protein
MVAAERTQHYQLLAGALIALLRFGLTRREQIVVRAILLGANPVKRVESGQANRAGLLPHTAEPQGTLHPNEPGSNGGVMRGTDLKPRHVARAIYLKMMTDPGLIALPPASNRSGAAKRKRARAAHAFITNAALMGQGIMLDAAEGDPVARGQGVRLLNQIHEALQPTQHEAKGGGRRRSGRRRHRQRSPLKIFRLWSTRTATSTWTLKRSLESRSLHARLRCDMSALSPPMNKGDVPQL